MLDQLINKLTSTEVIAATLAVLASSALGARFYRRQLILQAKIKANDELAEKIKGIRNKTNDIIGAYRRVMAIAAQIGDEFRDIKNPTKSDLEKLEEKTKDKYNELGGLIDKVYLYKNELIELIDDLRQNPLLPSKLAIAVDALNIEFQRIWKQVDQAISLITHINTIPQTISNNGSVSPELFKGISDVIEGFIDELNEFQILIWDMKSLLYNNLVGNVLPKSKIKIELRRTLTRKGIRDYRTGIPRRERIKQLLAFLFRD